MIKIFKHDRRLLLRYQPGQYNDAQWIDDKLEQNGQVTLRRTFTLKNQSIVTTENLDRWYDNDRIFELGVSQGEYYKIARNILGLKHDLLIYKQMTISDKTFIANRDISIFKKIDSLIDEPIIIGGDTENAIPTDEFEGLLQNFPTSTELTHYSKARISRVLMDYFNTMSDAQKKLDKYLSTKKSIKPRERVYSLKRYELQKFEYVRDELRMMLKEAESYSEKDWQKIIVGFLLLIFPKYISVLENLLVKDFYSNPTGVTNRYIDLTLVDANGTIDIIEIKKPFENCILSRRKYRDNYTPRNELSGSVMQVEKYLFHLSKWGREGENIIMKKRGPELPDGFVLKITNPKAMIILGRDSVFAGDQRFDFEIIKRKYANVMDIMTYDDLLLRLDNIIDMIKRQL